MNINSKKSQIQMGESVAIIIIVIFLLILGLVFWNKLNVGGIRNLQREQQELSVIDIAKTVQEMPEFRCSSTKSEKPNCFDKYKIYAFNKTFSSGNSDVFDLYNYYFKHSRVSFREIYPEDITITVYDSNITNTTKKQIDVPINIYDPITKRYSFGLIVVEGYYS